MTGVQTCALPISYHGVLQASGIAPLRKLEDDQQLTSGITSYGGSGSTIVKPSGSPTAGKTEAVPADTAASRTRVAEQLARLRQRLPG